MNLPNPKKHLILSLIKSVIRIVGAISLFFIPFLHFITLAAWTASACFLLAEIVGIIEELV